MRRASPTFSAIAGLRGARWRAGMATLAVFALLAQFIAAAVCLGASATVPFWDDPSSICGDAGAANGSGGAPNKAPLASCPILLAAHQLATALTPGSPAVTVPTLVVAVERTIPHISAAHPVAHRKPLPRGPPATV